MEITSKYYTKEDFACHGESEENVGFFGSGCGCGGYLPEIDPIHLQFIEEFAEVCFSLFGKVPNMNCTYRCDVNNERWGGKPGINHNAVPPYATDFGAEGFGVDALADIATALNADGVGRYYDDNFVHVDCRDGRTGTKYTW